MACVDALTSIFTVGLVIGERRVLRASGADPAKASSVTRAERMLSKAWTPPSPTVASHCRRRASLTGWPWRVRYRALAGGGVLTPNGLRFCDVLAYVAADYNWWSWGSRGSTDFTARTGARHYPNRNPDRWIIIMWAQVIRAFKVGMA